jgi:hypothetical protein
VAVRLPVTLVDRYAQPQPMPSGPMIERIRRMARDLGADEWAVRDRAQAEMLAIGPPVRGVLKTLRPSAGSSEAAQRIEVILMRLGDQLEATIRGASGGGTANGAWGGPVMPNEQGGQMLWR